MISFGYPLLLLGSIALLVPLLLYFINLQSYKKQSFNYVRLIHNLKKINTKRLKPFRLLILLNRLFLLICILLFFSGLYLRDKNDSILSQFVGSKTLYVDNAAYTEYQASEGLTILEKNKRVVNEVLSNDNSSLAFLYASHSDHRVNSSSTAVIKDFLVELDHSFASERPSKSPETNHLILVSDFSNKANWWKNLVDKTDTSTTIYLIKNESSIEGNIFIDSLIILDKFSVLDQKVSCKVFIRNLYSDDITDFSCRVFHQEILSNTFSINLKANSNTEFTLVLDYNPKYINRYKLEFDDSSLDFDNTFYFSIDRFEKIKILMLTGNNQVTDRLFLNEGLFDVVSSNSGQLLNQSAGYDIIAIDAGVLASKQLASYIVSQLEEGKQVLLFAGDGKGDSSKDFSRALNEIGIPHKESQPTDSLRLPKYEVVFSKESRKLLENIFEDKNSNAGLVYAKPVVDLASGIRILEARDGMAIINSYSVSKGELIVYNSFFNDSFSTLHKSSLFLPTLYELIFRSNQRLIQTPYFSNSNEIILNGLSNQLNSTDELMVSYDAGKFIPQISISNSGVLLSIPDEYVKPGTYFLTRSQDTIGHFSYNVSNVESSIDFLSTESLREIYKNNPKVSVSELEIGKTQNSEVASLKLLTILILLSLSFSLIEIILLRYSDL